MSSKPRIRALIVNDDGLPDQASSPFVFDFVKELEQAGFDCHVVLPSSQKSWIGKAYLITENVQLEYFYPHNATKGYTGPKTRVAKPVESDEAGQWILLDGSPATCSSIGLHNLFPDQIDIVISGPNFGRNTSSAFALSSGTIGAAMAASMSMVPSIALSYGVFQRPIAPEIIQAADKISVQVIKQLCQTGFIPKQQRHPADGAIDLYSINVPLLPSIAEATPKVQFTTLGFSRYSRLFSLTTPESSREDWNSSAADAGPGALLSEGEDATVPSVARLGEQMCFQWNPDIAALINPDETKLIEGTDIHALHKGHVSVTPLRASFASGNIPTEIEKGIDDKGFWTL